MEGCRNNFLDLLLRLGVGFAVVGAIVLIMALFGSNPQTAEEITGSRVNIYEMMYLFISMFTGGNPLSAAVLLLAIGLILIIIVLLIYTFNEEPSTNKRQHRG